MLQSIFMHQKKVMLLLQNVLRKIRKGSYKKCGCNVTKVVYLRPKDSEKGKTATKKDKCLFMIIVFQDMES